jgi:hypothetical protein
MSRGFTYHFRVGRKEVPEDQKATTRSVTLRPREWTFLDGVAEHLRAVLAGDKDPIGTRAPVSQAVRHLIERAIEDWPRDKNGLLVMKVGFDYYRTFDPDTGETAPSPSPGPSDEDLDDADYDEQDEYVESPAQRPRPVGKASRSPSAQDFKKKAAKKKATKARR